MRQTWALETKRQAALGRVDSRSPAWEGEVGEPNGTTVPPQRLLCHPWPSSATAPRGTYPRRWPNPTAMGGRRWGDKGNQKAGQGSPSCLRPAGETCDRLPWGWGGRHILSLCQPTPVLRVRGNYSVNFDCREQGQGGGWRGMRERKAERRGGAAPDGPHQ